MNIRKAQEKDFGAIIDILTMVNSLHNSLRPDIFKQGGAKYGEQELSKIIDDEQARIFVAEKDGILLGYIILFIKESEGTSTRYESKTCYIDDIGVLPAYQGEGVATALFEHAENFAREEGCSSITLNAYEGNDPAMKFYKKMGMKVLYREFMKNLY